MQNDNKYLSMRKTMQTLCILSVIFIANACGSNNKQTADAQINTNQKQYLHVAVMPTIDCLPIIVAQKQKLFKKHRMNIKLHYFNAQSDCDTAFYGNTAQAMVTDLVRAEKGKRNGANVSYATATNAYWQLIAAHNNRIKETKQLGDKTIAMTRYSATDLLTEIAVKAAKPSNRVYKIQINDIFIRLKMLNNCQLDAAWLPEPLATTARNNKNNVIADSREMDFTPGVIAFKNEYMDNMQNFINAYNEAVDSITKFGAKHYLKTLKAEMKMDEKTLQTMPDCKFSHAQMPQEKDVNLAKTTKLNP